jgi:hypothetical protein
MIAPLLAALSIAASEGEPPKAWAAPKGWTVESFAQGDLDGDGRPDLAVVLADPKDPPKVKLAVYLQQPDGSFRLHTTSPRAVCTECGGMNGPPVNGEPEITPKGILEIGYEGGAREEWHSTTKWRLDKTGHFILIGFSFTVFDRLDPAGEEPGSNKSLDVNLATLRMEDQLDGARKLKCKVDKKFQGLELSTFAYEDFDVGRCKK